MAERHKQTEVMSITIPTDGQVPKGQSVIKIIWKCQCKSKRATLGVQQTSPSKEVMRHFVCDGSATDKIQ